MQTPNELYPGEIDENDDLVSGLELLSEGVQLLTKSNRISSYKVIREYRVVTKKLEISNEFHKGLTVPKNTPIVVIRELSIESDKFILGVFTQSLTTFIACKKATLNQSRKATKAEASSFLFSAVVDSAKTRVFPNMNPTVIGEPAFSFVVTIDMCQSSKAWDQSLFVNLNELADLTGAPTPIGIAITGKWAIRHHDSFKELLSAYPSLEITWINHSFSHPLNKDEHGNYHFLTHPKEKMKPEVILLEQYLIEHKVVPSIWFRFPGLVYDERTLKELNELSLLPLDTNAWLAKNKKVEDGSLILIHGNGNDPVGLDIFVKEIERQKTCLENGDSEILPPDFENVEII